VPRAYDVANGIDSRWRRAALIQMTMPGTPYIYYGEELALRPGKDTVVDMRDRQRSPMLWDQSAGYGFTTGTPWLSFGADADSTNLAVEQTDPDSNYAYYEKLLDLRRGREAFGTGSLEILSSESPSLLAYARASSDETYWVVLSMDENAELSDTIAKKLEREPKLLFGSATLSRNGEATQVTLPEAGAAVFRVR
jgi:glycosidase